MSELQIMYAPQTNSPATSTVGALSAGTLSVEVLNASILPAPPMLLVLGGDTQTPETVLMTAKEGNILILQRAIEGNASSWDAGTMVARLFTATDLQTVQDNIGRLNNSKQAKITLSGLLKGDGESVVAAVPWNPMVAGSFDYLTPENVGAVLGVAGLDDNGKIMPEQHMRTVDVLEDWLYEGELDIGANGLFLRSPSNDDTTIILPTGLPQGMEVVVMRNGEGAVNFVAADGVILRCASDNPCIAHPYGVVYLKCLTSTENAAVWVVYGDIAPYVTDVTNAQEVAM